MAEGLDKVFHRQSPKRALLTVTSYMLRAFIDDSGSGGDSPWYVLAGYVGTTEAWNAFDKPWREMLDDPPKLEYFKVVRLKVCVRTVNGQESRRLKGTRELIAVSA